MNVSRARVSIHILGIVLGFALSAGSAYAATAQATDAYPSTSVPPGVRVSFIVTGTGFSTRPTYYLTDSFPGGATTVNIDIGGNFAWTPNKDDIGTHTLTIALSDTDGTSASASQTITVIPAATISLGTPSPSAAVAMGTPISMQTTVAGFFSPTYSISDSLSGSSIANARISSAGVFSWTPLAQDVGENTITVTAQDSYGTKATNTVDITVLPPAAVSVTKLAPGSSVHASSTLTFTAAAVGFVKPTFTVIDDTTGTTPDGLTNDGAAISWTPVDTAVGTHKLRITASDDGGRSAQTTLTISVLAPLPQQTATPAATAAPASSPTPTPQLPSAQTPAPTAVSATSKKTTASTAAPKSPTAASQPKMQNEAIVSATPTPTADPSMAYPSDSEPLVPLLASQELATNLVQEPQLTFVQFILHSVASFFGGIFGVFSR